MEDILRWVLVVISIPLLVLFIIHTIRRARSLTERIDEYHESQAAGPQQPGPVNPYQDLSELFGNNNRPDDKEQDKEK